MQGNIRYISLAVPLILAERTIVQYVIYKPWLGGVYAEYTTRGRGQRKFAAEINPERSEGLSRLQTSDDRDRVVAIFGIHTDSDHGSYVIYLSVWASLLARARVRVRVDLDLAVSPRAE